jgi:hypothetical protein
MGKEIRYTNDRLLLAFILSSEGSEDRMIKGILHALETNQILPEHAEYMRTVIKNVKETMIYKKLKNND